MTPLMSKADTLTIASLLLSQSAKTSGCLDCLEWGAGGSTVWFTDFLASVAVDYSWTAIEHHKYWVNKVAAKTDLTTTHLYHFPASDTRNEPMDEYVEYPRHIGKTYSVILVDGRKRRRCLIEAAKILKPNGIVLLHDAQRGYYKCAFEHYKTGRFLSDKLWSGKMD